MPYIRAEKRGYRIENGEFLRIGKTAKVSDTFVGTLEALIESGEITVHDADPNRRKPAPKPKRKKKIVSEE